jgi:hypothetical protein
MTPFYHYDYFRSSGKAGLTIAFRRGWAKTGRTPPGRPGYGTPGRPRYRPPGRPEYRPPGRPEYRLPGRPGYCLPGRPRYAPPGRPEYRLPSRPRYAPPGRPRDTLPAALGGRGSAVGQAPQLGHRSSRPGVGGQTSPRSKCRPTNRTALPMIITQGRGACPRCSGAQGKGFLRFPLPDGCLVSGNGKG